MREYEGVNTFPDTVFLFALSLRNDVLDGLISPLSVFFFLLSLLRVEDELRLTLREPSTQISSPWLNAE